MSKGFPEVKEAFLNEAETDAVIQQCVSEVRLSAFYLFLYCSYILHYLRQIRLQYQVATTYGRKMMRGYVRSKGLHLIGKQVAISKSLRRVNPADHGRRGEDTVR